tara:strand:- start:34042 stop:34284 length:243 start_codon:yes stop_codon:yes gene_type:complete
MTDARVKLSNNIHVHKIYGADNSGYVVRNELSDMLSFTVESIRLNKKIIANLQYQQAQNQYCRCDYFDVLIELGLSKPRR